MKTLEGIDVLEDPARSVALFEALKPVPVLAIRGEQFGPPARPRPSPRCRQRIRASPPSPFPTRAMRRCSTATSSRHQEPRRSGRADRADALRPESSRQRSILGAPGRRRVARTSGRSASAQDLSALSIPFRRLPGGTLPSAGRSHRRAESPRRPEPEEPHASERLAGRCACAKKKPRCCPPGLSSTNRLSRLEVALDAQTAFPDVRTSSGPQAEGSPRHQGTTTARVDLGVDAPRRRARGRRPAARRCWRRRGTR